MRIKHYINKKSRTFSQGSTSNKVLNVNITLICLFYSHNAKCDQGSIIRKKGIGIKDISTVEQKLEKGILIQISSYH